MSDDPKQPTHRRELFSAVGALLSALAIPIVTAACIMLVIFAGASYDRAMTRCIKSGGHWIKMDGRHQCVNWIP